MKNHHEVGHFKNRLMIGLLSLIMLSVMAGQSYATDCSTCHGMPPLDSANGIRQPSTGAFKGSHSKHYIASDKPAACVSCHGSAAGTYSNDHAAPNFQIKINSNINTSQHPSGASYSKGNTFAQTASPADPLGSCSNVNCHFEATTPAWGSTPPAADCNTCHTTTLTSGSHTKHRALYGGTASCTYCHPNYGTSNFSHATSAGKRKISVLLNYTAGTSSSNIFWLPSQSASRTYGTCNASCHGNGSSTTPTKWGITNTVGCNFCHPNLSTGHNVHIGSLLNEVTFYNNTSVKSSGTTYKFGCAICHPVTTSTHIDGHVDVDLGQNAAGGHLKALNGVSAGIDGAKRCVNVYCHSNGLKPTYTFATTPIWGAGFSSDKCAACHGNSPNDTVNGQIVGSPAHTAHVVGIHYANIFNGVSKKLAKSGYGTVNAAHGVASRSTTMNCNICHAITVTTSANDNNTACIGCHNGTTAALRNPVEGLIADASRHVNGSVDLSFINQKIVSKAQLAPAVFAGYTAANAGGWTRNKNIYKAYTSGYDVTKANLAAVASWSLDGGVVNCSNVACHANKSVAWNDNSVTCSSCHTRLR